MAITAQQYDELVDPRLASHGNPRHEIFIVEGQHTSFAFGEGQQFFGKLAE